MATRVGQLILALILAGAGFDCRGSGGVDSAPPAHYADPSNVAQLTLATPPQRIVSLAPNLTEMLFALGAGDQVVGVTRFCDEPPEAATRTRVGGFVDLDYETVVGLRPDLVVAVKNSQNLDFVRWLERSGVVVYWTRLVSEADVFRVTGELAGLLGRETAGAQLQADVRERMAAIEARLAGAAPRRVLLVFGHRPLTVAGPGTFADALIRRAGGANVVGDDTLTYPSWSMENVVRAAPDVIIDAYMGGGDDAADDPAASWAGWRSIPAVRNGRVSRLRSTALLRPGPRLPEAFEAIARLIHPERFAAAGDPR